MKAKLIKTIDGYHLRALIKDIPRSINVYHKINKTEGEFGFGEHSGKLSKQNCNELFGVVDVEKLAEHYENVNYRGKSPAFNNGFIKGFNKNAELNKDKVFTLEDIRKAYYVGYEDGKSGATFFKQLIESLQQPTEIEVEIEMEDHWLKSRVDCCKNFHPKFGCSNIIKCTCRDPKLDSEGCLILKRK